MQSSHHSSPIVEWTYHNTPYWADKPIARWDQDLLDKVMPFIKSHYWCDRDSINVFSVVGTAHPDYIGLTWFEFLLQGKRMRVNQHLLETNPTYYLDTQVKHPSMLYISLDGNHWYVNGDGNHRTCLARFQFERLNAQNLSTNTTVHGVTCDDYRVDWEFYDTYLSIQKLLQEHPHMGSISAERKSTRREDNAGWKIDYYETKLKFVDKTGEHFLDKEAASTLFDRLHRQSSGLLARWGFK